MADVDAEVARQADELYTMHPDGFAAARDERIKAARAEGNQPLARELGKLRRPTLSAWLVNQLWRDQREVMEQLFEVANGLLQAQAQASGAELRRLTGLRRDLETALLRRAEALAARAGVSVSPSMAREVQETLAAALADPDVADQIRSGRLVKPAAYAGFGGMIAAPGGDRPREPEKAATAREPAVKETRDERAARRAREQLEQAEQRAHEAREGVESASQLLAEHTRAAETAQKHHQTISRQIERLKEELRDLEEAAEAARSSAMSAVRGRDQAERAFQAANREQERADLALAELQKA